VSEWGGALLEQLRMWMVYQRAHQKTLVFALNIIHVIKDIFLSLKGGLERDYLALAAVYEEVLKAPYHGLTEKLPEKYQIAK
jgi:hypothetical protein